MLTSFNCCQCVVKLFHAITAELCFVSEFPLYDSNLYISKDKALYSLHNCAMHGSVYSLQLRPLSKEESWGHLPISFPKGIAAWYGRSWCYGRKCVVIYFCQVPRSHRWKISFWVVWTGPSAGGGWRWAGSDWEEQPRGHQGLSEECVQHMAQNHPQSILPAVGRGFDGRGRSQRSRPLVQEKYIKWTASFVWWSIQEVWHLKFLFCFFNRCVIRKTTDSNITKQTVHVLVLVCHF